MWENQSSGSTQFILQVCSSSRRSILLDMRINSNSPVMASGTCGELTAGGKLALVEIRHMPVGRQIFALWRRSSPYSRDFETLTIEISSLVLQQEDQPLEETGHP